MANDPLSRRSRYSNKILLSLLWSLVEVHSQPAAPYVSFMGENLPNHAYVDLTLVGEDDSDPGNNVVRCITDLNTCCVSSQGAHRGDWYFPDETKLTLISPGIDIFENRGAQQVTLRRRHNAMEPSGIYRCDIPTVAVHDDIDLSVRETVYVGLYLPSGGNVLHSSQMMRTLTGLHLHVNVCLSLLSHDTGDIVINRVTFTPVNGASHEFILTCISTGGPTTTVTWTRDEVTITEGNEIVLDDPVTAQYTHTLTVAGRMRQDFTCTVANNKPSKASQTISIEGSLFKIAYGDCTNCSTLHSVAAAPTGFAGEVLDNLTSVMLTWTPPNPPRDTSGYMIEYDNGEDEGSKEVDGVSTTSRVLTGLQNGTTYNISIVGTSEHFPSAPMSIMVQLIEQGTCACCCCLALEHFPSEPVLIIVELGIRKVRRVCLAQYIIRVRMIYGMGINSEYVASAVIRVPYGRRPRAIAQAPPAPPVHA